jgi:hypothetical protein
MKLEEARIVLNKLMGPKGVLTERERQKYLKINGVVDNSTEEQTQGMRDNN